MKYLFLFAHPDDETVACAGTLHKLVQHGEDVMVVSVTDGSGGQVHERAKAQLAVFKTVGTLRRYELEQTLQFLGIKQHKILNFSDGKITNDMVWGQLKSAVVDCIDEYRPDVVVTFDHSGWYFHLDHIAVSIATTLAVQEAKFSPDVFFLSHFRVNQSKWKYIYSDQMPITHRVDVTESKEMKLHAFELHASQDLTEPRRQVTTEEKHFELYQLAHVTEKGKQLLNQQALFVAVDQTQGVAQHDT
jgi:N-acetylglucosamine malate deacetylase 2